MRLDFAQGQEVRCNCSFVLILAVVVKSFGALGVTNRRHSLHGNSHPNLLAQHWRDVRGKSPQFPCLQRYHSSLAIDCFLFLFTAVVTPATDYFIVTIWKGLELPEGGSAPLSAPRCPGIFDVFDLLLVTSPLQVRAVSASNPHFSAIFHRRHYLNSLRSFSPEIFLHFLFPSNQSRHSATLIRPSSFTEAFDSPTSSLSRCGGWGYELLRRGSWHEKLLASPTFHRVVRNLHSRMTGAPRQEPHGGGTQLEGQENKLKEFFKIYAEEFKNEFRKK